jgi:hypothetical protein
VTQRAGAPRIDWLGGEGHETQLIAGGKLWRWRCSCGAGTSGRWYSSQEEAEKAASRHLGRSAEQERQSS